MDAYQRQRKTALMLAAGNGHVGLVEILCQLGANLDLVDSQVAALHLPGLCH
jgi:hypothetical protein